MHFQTQEMEDGVPPTPETQAAIGDYTREAAMSGVLLAGEGVHGSSQGARVEVEPGAVRVLDGLCERLSSGEPVQAVDVAYSLATKREVMEQSWAWRAVCRGRSRSASSGGCSGARTPSTRRAGSPG